ncbi:uncharacterized protein ARMOST_18302 [Armillaria ostoyae]|uniref:Uncharacterized protein n=1 Tax=Armillaria ostoyae TaxID=47428 RepID=A0A284S1D9_ARMOS|nr:uncharacterized protein ARMOST_18302 [Armillaria ostoyae]
MAVSERVRTARLTNASPALEHVVFPNRVEWNRPSHLLPRSRSSSCLAFDDRDCSIRSFTISIETTSFLPSRFMYIFLSLFTLTCQVPPSAPKVD